eukprot:6342396-Prymnesium_polylepis.1
MKLPTMFSYLGDDVPQRSEGRPSLKDTAAIAEGSVGGCFCGAHAISNVLAMMAMSILSPRTTTSTRKSTMGSGPEAECRASSRRGSPAAAVSER